VTGVHDPIIGIANASVAATDVIGITTATAAVVLVALDIASVLDRALTTTQMVVVACGWEMTTSARAEELDLPLLCPLE
jgi:hypothetical protein